MRWRAGFVGDRLDGDAADLVAVASLSCFHLEIIVHRIVVSPQGNLGFVAFTGSSSEALLSAELCTAFEQSIATGLTLLSCQQYRELVAKLPVEFLFWRTFSRQYFSALCRQYSQSVRKWATPESPDIQSLDELRQTAPPMLGLEYLQNQTLIDIWSAIDQHVRTQVAKHEEGLAGYLRSLDSAWNLIGRVTFHLAENKKNPDAPFAFMATYTVGKSDAGAPVHIPLGQALKQSIEQRDTTKLDQLLEPVTRASSTCKLVKELLESRRLFAPQAWGIRNAYEFLSAVPVMEQAGIVVRVPDWWNARKPPRPQVSVRIGTGKQSVMSLEASLDFDVNVAIDGQPLSDAELKLLLANREGLALLRGKWVQVDTAQLQSALDQWRSLQSHHVGGIDFLQGMRLLSGVAMGSDSVDDTVREWSRVEAGPWLEQVLGQLRKPSGSIAIDPAAGIQATLRPYQADGVRWLWFATQLGLGVCLADDMGLGKTLQVIALMVQLKQHSERESLKLVTKNPRSLNPCLLIVPTSLLGNWQRELEKFAPQLRLFVAHRSASEAKQIQKIAEDPATALVDYDVVMITYGMIRKADWLHKLTWRLVVLDEAQAIKNADAAQSKAIKKIPAACRLTMTGTPVENHLGDLWSLFDFSSPKLLGSATEFKRFVSSKDDSQRAARLASLRDLIRPYILRRLKTDPKIAPDLPDKTEMRVDCGLSPTQAALYADVINDLEQTLAVASGIQRRGIVLAVLMQLKQICNHPALYLKQPKFHFKDSGKYHELAAICETIAEKQEKVLVFSQFQSMCAPISEFLESVFGRSGLVLTGKTSAKARSKLVADFQQPFGPQHFVISVKAGGTGLNLTEACHVVHFDRWWNPAVEDQATDRAFRIGQTRNVLVHKFVTRGTLEERIDDLIQSKKQISRELFDSTGELNLTEMSNDQLMKFVSLDLTKSS